jgi:hypothetical protein
MSRASEYMKDLARQIDLFQRDVGEEYDVVVQIASAGLAGTLEVDNIGFNGPSLIVFDGILPDGNTAHLVQDISQISLLIIAVPRTDLSKPRRTIGFRSTTEDDA